MNRSVQYGVCGIGRMGKVHCRFFAQEKEKFTPAAFCDFSLERAKDAAAQYGGCAYSDFAEFLKDPAMELVIIATRSMDHVSNAKQALEAGKAVLLEKPFTVTAADYEELKKLVKLYPGKLFFGLNHRFETAHTIAYELLQSGLIGKLHTVRVNKAHPFAPRCDWQMMLSQGGGQLSVWGPHVIDQTLHFLNSPVREVWSDLKSILTPGDADDCFRIILRAESGAVGEVEVSNATALQPPYCELYGNRGSIRYAQDQKALELRYIDPEFVMPELKVHAEPPPANYIWHHEVKIPWVTETREVVPEVIETVLIDQLWNAMNGVSSFPVTPEQALEVVRIAEVVKKQNPQYHWLG